MTMETGRPELGLIPATPGRELEELERHFEDIFGRSFLPAVLGRLPVEQRGWVPSIEVFEKEDKFLVKAELPGIKQEDIHVSAVGERVRSEGRGDYRSG